MQALKAGCLLLAVAFAIDLAALVLTFGSIDDVLNAGLLQAAASSIAVLSLACFARAVPSRHGFLARRAPAIFWSLIAASVLFWVFRFVAVAVSALLDFGHAPGAWTRLAFLALWAALGCAVAFDPLGLGHRIGRVGPILAGIGCVIALAVGVAVSWDSFDFDRGAFAYEVAGWLALFAVALSFGGNEQSSSVTEPSLR